VTDGRANREPTVVPSCTVFGVNVIVNLGEIVVRTTAECFSGTAAATAAKANTTTTARAPTNASFIFRLPALPAERSTVDHAG
jgi:hypothetical protein